MPDDARRDLEAAAPATDATPPGAAGPVAVPEAEHMRMLADFAERRAKYRAAPAPDAAPDRKAAAIDALVGALTRRSAEPVPAADPEHAPAPAPPTTPEPAPAAVPEPEHKLPEHLVRRLGNLADLAATERAEAEAPAAEAAPAPAATLEATPDPAAVLAAMARLTWADANDGAECPAHRLPTSTDLVAGWLPECPAAPWDEVAAAERAAGPGAVGWLSSVGGALAGASAADLEAGANMAAVLLGNSVAAAHRQWCGAAVPRPPHPLRPLVDAWQRLAPVVMVADPRPHSVLPGTLAGRNGGLRPVVVSNDQRYLDLPMPFDGAGEAPRQLWLGFEHAGPDRVPVLPLVSWDARGGSSMTRGRGAALGVRLYVETLLAVPPELRRIGSGAPAVLRAKVRDVVAGLWPRGWQRGRDWPRLLGGLDEMRRLGVEWEYGGTGGVWFAVTVRSVPRAGRLDDLMQFEVLLPPGSGPGPLVARPHLRLLGLDSAPAYRLYMSLCWYWDHYGTRRGRLIGADAPAPGKRPAAAAVNVSGRLINPAALRWYPALSPDDVAAMSYALGDLAADGTVRRNQRRAAREALERVANVTGAIVVPAEQADGVRGCVRVLPPPDHKAAHDAAAELWRAKRPRDLTTGTR